MSVWDHLMIRRHYRPKVNSSVVRGQVGCQRFLVSVSCICSVWGGVDWLDVFHKQQVKE